MREAFGRGYARYYDLLYSDKDYAAESEFLETLFSRYSTSKIRSVLDIACGTGGHALMLTLAGYNVTGMDSSPFMIQIARGKASSLGVKLDFRTANVTSFGFGRKFDACISMFDSIDYLDSHEEVVTALGNVRRHLRRGGLFVFQFWNGLAVLSLGASSRSKIVDKGDLKLIRLADPVLRPMENVCDVNYRIIALKGGKLIHDFSERHRMRYFFPEEIRNLLLNAKYELVGLHVLGELDVAVDSTHWSIVAVAKAWH